MPAQPIPNVGADDVPYNPLILPDAPGMPRNPAPGDPMPLPPILNDLPNMEALQLPADARGDGPNAMNPVPGDDDADPWTTALNTARNLNNYIHNSLYSTLKGQQLNSLSLRKLERIYWRIRSLQSKFRALDGAVQASVETQRALIGITNLLNAGEIITPELAQNMSAAAARMRDEGQELQNSWSAAQNELNRLATAMNLQNADRIADDTAPIPLVIGPDDDAPAPGPAPGPAPDPEAGDMRGGRKKQRRTKHKRRKGGFKFTRAANSKRSLRMATRKKNYKGYKKKYQHAKRKSNRKHTKRQPKRRR